MTDRVDVVVAGGGLAGSIAARELAVAGHRVLLAERKSDPGAFNYCGEAVSARGIAPFNVLTPDLIAAPVDGGVLVGPGPVSSRLLWPGVGHVLHRDRLLRRLFTRAAEAGADARLEHEVVGVERDRSGSLVGVHLRAGGTSRAVRCGVVIAADGVASGVGRRAGIDTRLAVGEVYSCAQYRMREVPVEPGFLEFWIGDVYAPGGYAWVFPRGPEEANVGLAIVANRPSTGGATATTWLKRFRRQRFQLAGKIESYITGGIPTLLRRPPTSAQGVVLAGDAMRAPDPLSAAGIAEAMESGRLAAACVHEALAEGDLSARRLAAAGERYHRDQRRRGVMARIRRVFDRLDDDAKRKLAEACHRGFDGRRIDHLDGRDLFLQLLRTSPGLVAYVRYLVAPGAAP